MTNLQEAKLAREAEICYVTVAMVTDYDCWHPDHDAVTVTDIIANLVKNADNACRVVAAAVERACPPAAPANAARRWRTPSSPTANWCPKPPAGNWTSSLASTSCNDLAAATPRPLSRAASPWPPDLLQSTVRTTTVPRPSFGIVAEGLADRFEPAPLRRLRRLSSPKSSRPAKAPPSSNATAACAFRARSPDRTAHASTSSPASPWAPTSPLPVSSSTPPSAAFPMPPSISPAPRKNWELFAADPRIRHLPVTYRRGTLRDRLAAGPRTPRRALRCRQHRRRSRFAPDPTRPAARLR